MTKKEAVIVLIQNSNLLDQKTQLELLGNINTLSEGEIEAIGQFLAIEKRLALAAAPHELEIINNLTTSLKKQTTP